MSDHEIGDVPGSSPDFAAKMSSMNAGGTQGGIGAMGGGEGLGGFEIGAGQLSMGSIDNAIEGSTAISTILSALGVRGLEKCFSFISQTSAAIFATVGLENLGIFHNVAKPNPTPLMRVGAGQSQAHAGR